MALDADRVRCDILKMKRKICMSYPEGSHERNHFIITSKISEMAYLANIMNENDYIGAMAKTKRYLVDELMINVAMLFLSAMLVTMMLCLNFMFPHHFFLKFWEIGTLPFLWFLNHSYREVWKLYKSYTFIKDDYKQMKDKITQLKEEIRNLK